ncbi:MAG: tRNA epoxyqueuosine(34) reductase QueG, partial [Candidatus Krumholzibacteriota bacterium]|nr:tRNA epoxyqueuosine(34) reductase QueG [Candidatus Krumholzibacteriota bacterium]
AKSIICTALNYYDAAPSDREGEQEGVFAMYARGRDYHAVFSEMLSDMSERLSAAFPRMKSVACVDTQPISERDIAIRSGVAWLGKNTNVISPEYGSWIFLGELLTNLDLRPDQPLESLCGQCTRCIDACPTGALDTPFTLDARRCISYLTIEHRGEIPSSMHEKIGLDVYGCDTCQSVCPFNEVAQESVVFDRRNRSALVDMKLEELVDLSDERFRQLAQGSSIERCKPEGMRRNARIVQANAERAPIRQPAAGSKGDGKETGFYSQGK